mmetsp:Transcript_14620/g.34707  ORF Transcript_14620/g.34707 Transcript_14620/m.34707 type:complete len:432 (-) Transcript_14620:1883-3178(-)
MPHQAAHVCPCQQRQFQGVRAHQRQHRSERGHNCWVLLCMPMQGRMDQDQRHSLKDRLAGRIPCLLARTAGSPGRQWKGRCFPGTGHQEDRPLQLRRPTKGAERWGTGPQAQLARSQRHAAPGARFDCRQLPGHAAERLAGGLARPQDRPSLHPPAAPYERLQQPSTCWDSAAGGSSLGHCARAARQRWSRKHCPQQARCTPLVAEEPPQQGRHTRQCAGRRLPRTGTGSRPVPCKRLRSRSQRDWAQQGTGPQAQPRGWPRFRPLLSATPAGSRPRPRPQGSVPGRGSTCWAALRRCTPACSAATHQGRTRRGHRLPPWLPLARSLSCPPAAHSAGRRGASAAWTPSLGNRSVPQCCQASSSPRPASRRGQPARVSRPPQPAPAPRPRAPRRAPPTQPAPSAAAGGAAATRSGATPDASCCQVPTIRARS